MKRLMAVSMTLTVLWAGSALADSQSLFTLGLGTNFGLTRISAGSEAGSEGIVSEFNARLRMLTVLGFDFHANVTGEQGLETGEVFASAYRLSGMLYLVPTSVVSVYLTGGFGTSSASDLFDGGWENRSYHGGAGLEFYIDDHFAVEGQFLVLVPQVSHLVVSQMPLRLDENGSIPSGSINVPDASDYFSIGNFQATVGLTYYF